MGDYELRMEWITWVEENSSQLICDSRGVLGYRKACRSDGAIMIIHWNLEVSTLQVGVGGIKSEVLTTAPRDLQDVHEGRRGSNTRKLTDASLRGVGAGAATTRSASKPRVSKVVRPVGWNISLVEVLSMAKICFYMSPRVPGAAGTFIIPRSLRTV